MILAFANRRKAVGNSWPTGKAIGIGQGNKDRSILTKRQISDGINRRLDYSTPLNIVA